MLWLLFHVVRYTETWNKMLIKMLIQTVNRGQLHLTTNKHELTLVVRKAIPQLGWDWVGVITLRPFYWGGVAGLVAQDFSCSAHLISLVYVPWQILMWQTFMRISFHNIKSRTRSPVFSMCTCRIMFCMRKHWSNGARGNHLIFGCFGKLSLPFTSRTMMVTKKK